MSHVFRWCGSIRLYGPLSLTSAPIRSKDVSGTNEGIANGTAYTV